MVFLAGLVASLWWSGSGATIPSENLLVNGDFEEAQPLEPEALAKAKAEGWRFLGPGLYPSGWELGQTQPFYVPGLIEIVEDARHVKHGRRALRISTPGGSNLLRTTLYGRFRIPPTKAVQLAFWVRGTYGLDLDARRPGARYDITLQVQTAVGGPWKSVGGSGTGKSSPDWREIRASVSMPEAVGPFGRVILYAYQAHTPEPATLVYDDIRITEAPAPAPATEPAALRPKLIRTSGFDTPGRWRLPDVAGRPFRFVFNEYQQVAPDDQPEFFNLLRSSAALIHLQWEPPAQTWIGPETPFMIYMLRWNEAQFHLPGPSTYGLSGRLPEDHLPRRAADGIRSADLNGWIAEGPPPQWLIFDLGLAVPVARVHVQLPAADRRQTAYGLETSIDGKSWTAFGEASGRNPPEGRTHAHPESPARFVRLTVRSDSTGEAKVAEVTLEGRDGKALPVMFVEASSTKPISPLPHVPTIHERGRQLREKYGPRFLGFLVAEWDNDIGTSHLDKWRRSTRDPDRWRRLQATYPFRFIIPQTREESAAALTQAYAHMQKVYGGDIIAHCGWNGWEHYGCEFGSVFSCEEISQWGPEPTRQRLAFGRGAARQYGRPWMVYFASAIKTADSLGYLSDSLFWRQLMVSWLSGCNLWMEEKGWFVERDRDAGFDRLTRFGRVLVEADRFFRAHPDRGVHYTPIAIGLDWLHGYSSAGPWQHLDAQRPDEMIRQTLGNLLPQHSRKATGEGDNHGLSNSPCGDAFDVLVLNPPSGVVTLEQLAGYKALVLLGDIRWSPTLADRVKAFAEAGGTVLLNVSHQPPESADFLGFRVQAAPSARSHKTLDTAGGLVGELTAKDDFQAVTPVTLHSDARVLLVDEARRPLLVGREHGRGLVLTCLVDAGLSDHGDLAPSLRWALRQLHDDAMPVAVQGDIHFLVNRLKTGWLVTLVNNRGVTTEISKVPGSDRQVNPPVTVDPAKESVVGVKLHVPARQAQEWVTGQAVRTYGTGGRIDRFVLSVPPGEVRLVELSL